MQAVATSAVVVHHVGLPDSAAAAWRKIIAECGFIGVALFFLLSGSCSPTTT
jgi:peptidoglycan/LPS O-acetylase OafA/YrhL